MCFSQHSINNEFIPLYSSNLNISYYQNFETCLPIAYSLSQPTFSAWEQVSTIVYTSTSIR